MPSNQPLYENTEAPSIETGFFRKKHVQDKNGYKITDFYKMIQIDDRLIVSLVYDASKKDRWSCVEFTHSHGVDELVFLKECDNQSLVWNLRWCSAEANHDIILYTTHALFLSSHEWVSADISCQFFEFQSGAPGRFIFYLINKEKVARFIIDVALNCSRTMAQGIVAAFWEEIQLSDYEYYEIL